MLNMNPLAEDVRLVSCFFCFEKIGNSPGNRIDGNRGCPADLSFRSLKSLCRYLSSGTEKYQTSSEPTNNLDNAEALQVKLCRRCASVQNSLSELIQLQEIIQMKISYWLEALHGILVKADEGNNGDKSLGVCKETRSDAQLVRTEILNKCLERATCSSLFPRIRLKRLPQPSSEIGIIPKDHISTGSQSVSVTGAGNGQNTSTNCLKAIEPFPSTSSPDSEAMQPPTLSLLTDELPPDEENAHDSIFSAPASPTTSTSASSITLSFSSKPKMKPPPPSKRLRQRKKTTRPPSKTSPVKFKTSRPKKPKAPSDLTCSVCKKQFSTRKNLLRHEAIVHQGLRTTCDKCGKSFTPTYFNEHQRLHCTSVPLETRTKLISETRKTYLCHFCDKIFSHHGALSTHIRDRHSGREHQCPTCNRKFNYADSLKKHLLLKTCQEKKPEMEHVCDVCKKGFPAGVKLASHKYRNHKFRFECQTCGKSWGEKRWYAEHMERHHNPERNNDPELHQKRKEKSKELSLKRKERFQCKEGGCGRKFSYRRELRVHMVKEHGTARAEDAIPEESQNAGDEPNMTLETGPAASLGLVSN